MIKSKRRVNAVRHKIAEYLRDYMTDICTDDYNDDEVLSLWTPCGCIFVADDYGDINCICGHPIKYAFEVSYDCAEDVKVSPVGSVCIISAFGNTSYIRERIRLSKDLRRIYAFLKRQWVENNGKLSLDEDIVSSKNGFTSESIGWLSNHIDGSRFEYLINLHTHRNIRWQSDKQKWYSHYTAIEIGKAIRAAHGKVL